MFRYAIICFALVAVCLCQYYGETYVEDGCYFLHGEKIGCMKATVYACDREWFFQLTTPMTRDHGGTFIIADGIIPIDKDYYNCFQMENECDFCLTFYDATLSDDGILTTQSSITTQCRGEGSVPYDLGEFRASGPACGEENYFYLPCPTRTLRDYYSPISASTVDQMFEYYGRTGSYDEILYVDDGCLWLAQNDIPLGAFLCPSVLMDTCGGEAFITSSAGISFREPIYQGTGSLLCMAISNGHDFCVQPTMFDIASTQVYGSLLVSIVDAESGETFYEVSIDNLEFDFPDCGESHLTCWDIYSISYIKFTSGLLSELLSAFFSSSSTSESSNSAHHRSPRDSSHWGFPSPSYYSDSPRSSHWLFESPSDSPNSPDSSDSGTATTGIVLGTLSGFFVLLAVIVVVVVILIVFKRKKKTSVGSDVYDLMVQDSDL